MLAFSFYLLKAIICSGVLFGYYWFFLRNKIFHGYNRFYLLAIVVLSLSLPMMKINIWQKASEHPTNVIKMLQVVNSSDEYMDEVIIYSKVNHINKEQIISFLFITVCAVFCFVLLQGLYRIRNLIKTNPATSIENICFVKTNAKGTPFSFLRYIFWNDAIDIETKAGRQIFKHEVAHIQERHSYDKLFINVVLIIFWINPFFWLIRKELNMIHEFVADQKAIEDGDTADFAAMILQATYPQQNFQLANNFFYSPIKRRMLMLTKQNKKASYISRLLVLPVALFVFAAFTLKAKTYIEHGAELNKTFTVMIDAGHGGKDKGAASGEMFEKDITLILAKRIKALNQSDNIKIILTRETDIYQSPQQKAALAKEAGADLFISIHVDGAPATAKDMRTGMFVYVARDQYANSEASKLLASAVITNFQKNYGLNVTANPQQRENGIWVLQANSCPSVLIEAGCINNPSDLDYLRTDKAVETFANNILESISNYLSQEDKLSPVGSTIENSEPASQVKKESLPDPNSTLNSIEKDIYAGSGNPVKMQTINYTNFPASEEPLYIIDGKESSKAGANKIKPENIDNIRILKALTALPVYGKKATYGAIIINTKPDSFFGKKLTIIDGKVYEDNTELEMMMASSSRDFESMTLLDKDEAIKKYGKKGEKGAIEIITKPKQDQPGKQDISVTLSGMNGPKIHINQLKNIKTLEVSEADYTINSATVYFSGTGFKNVIQANLIGKSFENIEKYLNKIVPGSIISFDNIIAQKADGTTIEIKGQSFGFYNITKDDIVFSKVEVEPEFPGGKDAWYDYLKKNLDAGMPVNEGWKAGVYKIVVQFIVDAEGNVSDVKTDDHPGSKTANQCINLIKNGPKWIPALQNGKKVKAYRKQPITFVVSEQ